MQPSADFQRIKAFFHALSKVNTEASQYVYESLYKSAHSMRAKDIWADPIPFCATETDADNWVASNPTVGVKHVQVSLTEVTGSNGQAWYLDIGGTWIRPWIAPTDVPDDTTNAPSLGFEVKLYDQNDTFIPPTTGVWVVDYYAGLILFEQGYTPADMGWGTPKITCYQYIGQTLEGGGGGTFDRTLVDPSDGSWSDGFFDWQSGVTTIDDALDDVNELLTCVAPPDAQPLQGSDIDFSSITFVAGKISNPNGAYTLDYFSPGDATNFITDNTTIIGYTADPAQRFNKADLGTLYILDGANVLDSFDLGAAFVESERDGDQSYPPANGANGILTIDYVGKHDCKMWQRGNAHFTYTASLGDYRFLFRHQYNSTTDETNPFTLFVDVENAPQSVTSVTASEDNVVTREVSGVKFYDIGTSFNISTDIAHLFDHTYVDHCATLHIAGGSSDVNVTDPDTFGHANPPNWDDPFSVTRSVAIGTVKLEGAPATVDAIDPFRTVTGNESPSAIRLVWSDHQSSGDSVEYFDDETYRLPDTYNFDSYGNPITGQWDSTVGLTNGNLQVYLTGLIYPHVDFTSGYAPAQDPDTNYSGFSGNQVYYRAFQDNGNPHNNGELVLRGLTWADIGSNVRLEMKLPTQTGWLDLSQPFNSATFTGADGDGCMTGHSQSGSDLHITWSSGTFSTANSGYRYYLRVTYLNSNPVISRITELW